MVSLIILHDEVSQRKKQEKTFIYNKIPKPDIVVSIPIARSNHLKINYTINYLQFDAVEILSGNNKSSPNPCQFQTRQFRNGGQFVEATTGPVMPTAAA
jgi:hypothetical protein